MEMLYCIKHGTMENARPEFHLIQVIHKDETEDERTVQVGYWHEVFNPPTLEDPCGSEDYCNFPDGWATCPPPPFDMNAWMLLLKKDTGDFDLYVHQELREMR